MKLKLLIHRIREDFLDDTKRPELWDEQACYGALNATVDDLTGDIHLIRDETTASICSISVTASGYAGYSALSNRITYINDVWYTTTGGTVYTLDRKVYGQLQAETPTWRSTTAGQPQYYLTDVSTGYIHIYPKPSVNGTINLNVYRTWIKYYTPEDVMTGTPPNDYAIEVPDLKAIYHEKLIPGVLAKLYEKQDSEIFDEELYAKYKAEWNEAKEFIRRAELKYNYRDRMNVPLSGLV